MNEEIINQIKAALYKHYRIISNGECGCYVNGQWLSVDDVIRVISEELE